MIAVMLIDDHSIVRQAIAELLKNRGNYKIAGQFGDGAEALEILKKSQVDVVILDIAMPKIDGVQIVKSLRLANIQTPVLALSANEDPKEVKAILLAGANGFIPKNACVDELDFAIHSLLRGNAYLSPTITEKMLSTPSLNLKPSASSGPLTVLTPRELEIMKLIADGKRNSEIGTMLDISTRTVDTHRGNILKKLHIRTNAELVKLAISEGLITN
jgi:DNA-binding NarL/FixJ family response regulator